MVIQLDRCYKITFRNAEEGAGADFSLLDGFYEVVRSYGWNELMGARIDLQKHLLDLAGITDTTLIRTLQTKWVNDAFYYCIGMDQDRQIWVPESIIKGYPDPRIGSYKKLGLVLDLGVFANSDDFATLGKDIMKYLKANYGIDRPDGTVMVYGNQWMTVDDYENTDLRRKTIQGLAFTSQTVLIRPSDDFTETHVEFTRPVILSKEKEEIQIGAISESINITYGFDMKTIPESNEDDIDRWYYIDPENAKWIPAGTNNDNANAIYTNTYELGEEHIGTFVYSDPECSTRVANTVIAEIKENGDITVENTAESTFRTYTLDPNETDVLHDNTQIEALINHDFTAKVLKRIRLVTKLKKESYKWVASDGNVLYTKQITPVVGGVLYIDETCNNAIPQTVATYNAPTSTDEATVIIGSGQTAKTYMFDKAANYIKVDIGYRCRNTRVAINSPYSQAIKYAYENMALRQKIAALEEYIETRAASSTE